MKTPRAIALGGVLLDSVINAAGRVNEGALGGNAVYAACAMRLWLGPQEVAIAGHIPANYPDALIARLEAAGILTAAITRKSTPILGPEWFIYREDGSRRDEITKAVGDPDAMGFPQFRRAHPVTLADIPVSWHAAEGVHITGGPPTDTAALIAAFHGKHLTLDPGARVAELAPALTSGALLRGISAFLPSQKELSFLFPAQTATEALEQIVAQGVPIALVKQGAQGVLLKRAAAAACRVQPPQTTVLDPTGAGDSFCGGFLAGLVLGRDPMTCACMGAVAASFAINAFGPDALLAASPAEISRRLADVQALARTIQHP